MPEHKSYTIRTVCNVLASPSHQIMSFISCSSTHTAELQQQHVRLFQSEIPERHFQIPYFVRPTVQNPNNSSFTARNDEEKQEIVTFKKLESDNVW